MVAPSAVMRKPQRSQPQAMVLVRSAVSGGFGHVVVEVAQPGGELVGALGVPGGELVGALGVHEVDDGALGDFHAEVEGLAGPVDELAHPGRR